MSRICHRIASAQRWLSARSSPGSSPRVTFASGPRGNVALEIRQAPGSSDKDAEPDACLWHVRVRGRRQTTPETSVSGGTFPRGPLKGGQDAGVEVVRPGRDGDLLAVPRRAAGAERRDV